MESFGRNGVYLGAILFRYYARKLQPSSRTSESFYH